MHLHHWPFPITSLADLRFCGEAPAMVRFFFGQGGMIAWHVMFYAIVLVGIVLPMVSLLPLKGPGETPDTPSLGSFGVVMMIVGAMALITLVDCATLSIAARGSWFHKVVFVIATATVVAVAFYGLAVMVAQKQTIIPMVLLAAASGAALLANLFLLHLARTQGATLNLQFPTPILVLLILLSLPVAILLLLVPLGLILERFQH